MAWHPPNNAQWGCERCGKRSEDADGWIQIEIHEEGEEPQTQDFCAVCKLAVKKALKALAPKRLAAAT